MEKHKLLKEAMRRFPKGTIARFKSAPNVDHVSDGIFQILDVNHQGNTDVFSGEGMNCFYISHSEEGDFIGEWAMPVSSTILSGKFAVEVNNEREFKLLVEHFDSKGWNYFLDHIPKVKTKYPVAVYYKNDYARASINSAKGFGYKVIPFSEFAAEVGIKAPVFVMTSEDGVPLYEGDEYHEAHKCDNDDNWMYLKGPDFNMCVETRPVSIPNKSKAFSTRESAEKWIQEQNKPKCIDVKLFNRYHHALIYKDKVEIYGGGVNFIMKPSDLEDILHAYRTISK